MYVLNFGLFCIISCQYLFEKVNMRSIVCSSIPVKSALIIDKSDCLEYFTVAIVVVVGSVCVAVVANFVLFINDGVLFLVILKSSGLLVLSVIIVASIVCVLISFGLSCPYRSDGRIIGFFGLYSNVLCVKLDFLGPVISMTGYRLIPFRSLYTSAISVGES